MKNTIEELCELIDAAGLKITFDMGRNNTHPCTFCGKSDQPRRLKNIGKYNNGQTLTRPVCIKCESVEV